MSPFWPEGVAIEVRHTSGQPLEFEWQVEKQRIIRTSYHWRVHTLWWQGELWRHYWQVATPDTLALIYQDLLDGAWYLERIYA